MRQLTFRTAEFLRKALSYAEEFPLLSEEIFHSSTVNSVMKVLPDSIFDKIRYSDEYRHSLHTSSELRGKKCLIKLKEIMELEQEVAINDTDHHEMMKERQVLFSSVNAAQSSPSPSRKSGKPVSKPSQDQHDCKKSKTCNKKWGGLG